MIDETKINLDLGNKKFGSGKIGSGKKIFATKKVNKSYAIIIGIVAIFILMVVYIFNLEDTTQQQTASNSKTVAKTENQFDMKKIEAVSEDTKAATPPPPPPPANDFANQFDMNKIEQAHQEALKKEQSLNQVQTQAQEEVKPDTRVQELVENSILNENIDLKNQIEKLKKDIRDLKGAKSFENSPKAQEKKEEPINEVVNSDEMKKYLNSIKDSITLKGDKFFFDGINYYIGDSIKTYKIKDIQKNSIRFCDDWCYSLIY